MYSVPFFPLSHLHSTPFLQYPAIVGAQLRRGLSLPLGALSARRSPALPCFTVNIAVYALLGNRSTYIRIPPALYTFNGSGHYLCWKSARCVSLDSRCHKGPHSRRKAVKLVLSSAAPSTRSALTKPLASASSLPSPRLRRGGQSRPMQSRRPAFKPNVRAALRGGAPPNRLHLLTCRRAVVKSRSSKAVHKRPNSSNLYNARQL